LLGEGGRDLSVEALGVLEDEADGLAVVVGRVLAIAARLVDHAEALEPIDHVRVADEQGTGGGFGLIEAVGVDQVDDGVGRRVEVVIVPLDVVCGLRSPTLGGQGLVLDEAAALVLLAAATRARVIASDHDPWRPARGGDFCIRAG